MINKSLLENDDVQNLLTGDLEVDIASDVWISGGFIVQAGVKIGHGAAIGTTAIVTKDIEPYSIVAGIPAKIIRSCFNVENIQRLLWWTLDSEIIKKSSTFYMSDIEKCLEGLERIGSEQANKA